MKKLKRVVSSAALVLISGLVLTAGMPPPSVTEYFESTGGGIMITNNKLAYAVFFKPRKLVNGDDPWFARIEFENPQNARNPFVKLLTLPANDNEFSAESEQFEAIKNGKTYKVILKAYQDSERTKLIATHEQGIRFDMPREILKQLHLKLL